MASQVLQTITEKHLQCRICVKRCKQPKALGCMHSFCLLCLMKCYKNASTISCPLCLKTTTLPPGGIPSLRENSYIERLLWDVSSLHTKDADLAKIQHLDDEIRCGKHPGGVRRIYCVPCEKLICRHCTINDHPEAEGHHYVDCRPAAHERRKSIKNVCTVYKRDIKACERSLQESSEAMEAFEPRVARALKKIQQKASELIAEVKREEEFMIGKIRSVEHDRMSAFRVHRKEVTDMMLEKHFSLEVAEDIVNNYPDSVFLELYPEMKVVSHQSVPYLDPNLTRLSLAQHDCTPEWGCAISLGTLGSEEEWESHRCLLYEEAAGIRAIAALPGGEIAIAFFYSGDVTIFNTQGQEVRMISVGRTPYNFAAIQSKLVVADGTDSVKVYNINKDGTLAFDFPTVPPGELGETKVDLQSVAIKKDGNIIVGDVGRKTLTEHSPVDGSLLRTIPVKTAPYFLAVDSIYDRFVISGGKQPQVDVVDGNGNGLFTIMPTIHGECVTFCRGVCCDSTGIYLAMGEDFQAGHVHRYDAVGRFLSCIEDSLQYPYGITFTSDGKELAVTYYQSVKMYRKT